jgi:hypothetical protein
MKKISGLVLLASVIFLIVQSLVSCGPGSYGITYCGVAKLLGGIGLFIGLPLSISLVVLSFFKSSKNRIGLISKLILMTSLIIYSVFFVLSLAGPYGNFSPWIGLIILINFILLFLNFKLENKKALALVNWLGLIMSTILILQIVLVIISGSLINW